ncbi:MAG: VWA domain-containing protein [Planctomycetota bacterium]
MNGNVDIIPFLDGTLWTYAVSVVPVLAVSWLTIVGLARANRAIARPEPGGRSTTRPDDLRPEVWTALFIAVVMIVPLAAPALLALLLLRPARYSGPVSPDGGGNALGERVGAIVLVVLSLIFQGCIAAWLITAVNNWPEQASSHVAVALGFVCLPLFFLILAVAAVSSDRRVFRMWGALAFALHAIYALTTISVLVNDGTLRFFNLDAFWFLLMVPVVVLLWWRSQALMEGTRRVAALCFRLLLIAALVLAAAQPQVVRAQEGMAVIFVVDRSLSMPDQLLHNWYVDFIQQKIKHVPVEQAVKDQYAVIVFGGDPALIRRLDAAIDVQLVEPDDLANDVTDIAAAIRHALALFPDDRRKRLVLLTDGNQNRGDVVADLRLARHYGVTVDVVEIRTEDRRQDVRIERLDQPGEVKMGQRFEPRLVIWSTSECEAKLTVRVNGVPESMSPADAERLRALESRRNELLSTLPISEEALSIIEGKIAELRERSPPPTIWLKPGRNYPVLPARRYDRPGFYEMQVEIEVPPGVDNVPQNNIGSAYTVVRGRRRILYVHGDSLDKNETFLSELDNVFSLDATGGMAPPVVDVVDAGRMPRELAEWRMYDCVVLSNVPAEYWKEDQQRKLVAAIHRFGTGLVVLGGNKSYGAGGYRDQPIVDALPVRMEVEEHEAKLSGALVIILHTCEFEDWNAHTKAMCQAALDALSDYDQLGVVLYDYQANNGASWLFPLKLINGQRDTMKRLIATASPGDMPTFAPAFGAAYTALQKATANSKHCIVISDGDPSQPSLNLVSGAYKTFGITTASVIVQPHGGIGSQDVQTMKSIAVNGGPSSDWADRFYEIQSNANLSMLPQIFTREAVRIRTSLLHNGTFRPIITNQAEFLRGAAGMPPLGGYVGVTVKPNAQQALRVVQMKEGDDGSANAESHPLLAYNQHGLGRVLCFMSDVLNPGWCANWAGQGWPGYRRFWGDVINWTARQARADDDRVTIRSELVDGRGHVVIDAIDNGTPLMFSEANLVVVDPRQKAHPVRLRLIEPGRYEGWFDAPNRGSWQINLIGHIVGDEEGIPVMLTGGVSVPYAREFRDLDANSGLLATIATYTGGKYVRGQLVPTGELGGAVEARPERILRNDVLVNPQNFSETIRDAYNKPIAYDPFVRDLPVTHSFTPIWVPFAIAAVFLLFADVFFRKVFVSWTQLNETLAPAFAGIPLAGYLFVARSDVPLEEMERLRSVKALIAQRQQSERDRRARDAGDVLATMQESGALPAPRAVKVEDEKAAQARRKADERSGEQEPAQDRDFLKKLKEKSRDAVSRASASDAGPDLTRKPAAPAEGGADRAGGSQPKAGGGGLFDRLKDAKRGAMDDRDDGKKRH